MIAHLQDQFLDLAYGGNPYPNAKTAKKKTKFMNHNFFFLFPFFFCKSQIAIVKKVPENNERFQIGSSELEIERIRSETFSVFACVFFSNQCSTEYKKSVNRSESDHRSGI